MQRNLFNHHKYKRRWGRGLARLSNFIFSSSYDSSLPDFAWHRRKNNPFWNRDKEKNVWPHRLKILTLFISVLAIVLLGLYHPFFRIKNIKIDGLQRINAIEFKNKVLYIVNCKKLLIFPGESYFLVNLDDVRDTLKEKFPIESITIKKEFPNTLNILLEEKISNIIYDNGKSYSFIGVDGAVMQILRQVGNDEWQEKTKITTSTNEKGETVEKIEIIERKHLPPIESIFEDLGNYPIVFDMREKDVSINSTALSPETVQGIIQWFNLLNKRTNIPFGYIIIENELGDGVIKTREGWELRVKLTKEIDKQFSELQYILEKTKRPNINYIDLRYLGKVYWQ